MNKQTPTLRWLWPLTVAALLSQAVLFLGAQVFDFPDLNPNERPLTLPVNGLTHVRIEMIRIGNPNDKGQFNPHVYYTLFNKEGKESKGHAMSIKNIFGLTKNPDLNLIEEKVVHYVNDTSR